MFDPEKIKRFEPELGSHFYGGDYATVEEHPEGDYVLASDYDQLLQLYRELSAYCDTVSNLPQHLWSIQRGRLEGARQQSDIEMRKRIYS
jgi:hypothetical protein